MYDRVATVISCVILKGFVVITEPGTRNVSLEEVRKFRFKKIFYITSATN